MPRPDRSPQVREARIFPVGLLAGIDLYRWLAYGVAILATVAVLVGFGYHLGVRQLWEYQAEQAKAAVPIIVKQGEVTERVVTRYRDRIVKVQAETVTIEKEIAVNVPPSADPVLGVGWVRLHNAATDRSVPPAPGGVDVTAPAAPASQALAAVVANYGACHANAIQLVELQTWLRHQYETTNLKPLAY